MSYKRKEQKIRNIARIYLHTIAERKNRSSLIQNQRISFFQTAVELAYASLDAPLQKIINNDFFYQDYPGWWKLSYTRIKYIKVKSHAVNEFLEAFYEI